MRTREQELQDYKDGISPELIQISILTDIRELLVKLLEAKKRPCSICKGRGYVLYMREGYEDRQPCPSCQEN